MNAEGSSPVAVTAEDQDKNAARWRRAILNLSETLLSACDERRDLSPFLMEAMHSALENLLVYGEADDLLALEEWLNEEKPDLHQYVQADRESPKTGEESPVAQPLAAQPPTAQPLDVFSTSAPLADSPPAEATAPATERRVNGERRIHNERRSVPRLNGEYRSGRDRRRTNTPEFPGNAQAAPPTAAPPTAAPQAKSGGEHGAQPSGATFPTTF